MSVRTPTPPSAAQVQAWLARQHDLLASEREEERTQNTLLLSQCAPRVLARHGLALLGLGVSNVRIGAGAQTYVPTTHPD